METHEMSAEGSSGEEMSAVQRIIGVFTSPGKTFASIDANPTWILPLIIVIAVNLIFVFLAQDIIKTESLAQQEKAMIERGMDSAQIEEAMARTEQFMGISIWGFTILGTPIVLVIISAVFMFVGNTILGGSAKFKKVLSVTSWSWLIFALGAIISLPLVLAQETIQITFSLAAVMSDASRDTFLYRLLSKTELFNIWWLAVYSIGLAAIYKMRTQKVATAVVGVYVIYALVASALGGLFS